MERIPESANQILFSVNPNAGIGKHAKLVADIRTLVESSGQFTEVLTDINEVKKKSTALFSAGKLRAVVSVGGDGTAALLANTLERSIPLQLCPTGTENLLSKHLGILGNAESISQSLLEGNVKRFDCGVANGKRFLLMASCGFDAEVVNQLHTDRKGPISHWSWAIPIWRAIRTYKYPELKIFCDDLPRPIKSRWAFIFNFPCYAMGLKFCPNASASDGVFDLCTFRNGNLFNGMVYLAGVVLRRHRGWRDSHFEKAKKIVVESEEKVPYQVDGDPGGYLPLTLEMESGSLPLVVNKSQNGATKDA